VDTTPGNRRHIHLESLHESINVLQLPPRFFLTFETLCFLIKQLIRCACVVESIICMQDKLSCLRESCVTSSFSHCPHYPHCSSLESRCSLGNRFSEHPNGFRHLYEVATPTAGLATIPICSTTKTVQSKFFDLMDTVTANTFAHTPPNKK
jgi:hypothetical protein